MASPNGSWTLAGGKKTKSQTHNTVSKGKKKSLIEKMPKVEPNRKQYAVYLPVAMGIKCGSAKTATYKMRNLKVKSNAEN